MRTDLLRTRAIWLALAGLLALLVAADLVLPSRIGDARDGFVPVCTGCHDGLLTALPAR